MLNKNLHQAKQNKKDEFYTQLTDIENELKHYKKHLKNKVIYCNCDDSRASNFSKYFSQKFHFLGLKKLITTCYKNKNYDSVSQHKDKESVGMIYQRGTNGNSPVEKKFKMKGDGDFRNEECIELLKQVDIVVTNPPFSLFREYIAQLIEYNKKFIVIGHQNVITYKETFRLIKENKLWLGHGFKNEAGYFLTNYEDYATAENHKEGMIRVSGINWFTNLDYKERHEDLILYKTYTPEEYPKYDNYNAINVNKTKDIPMDYKGIMGVPITFLNKYNPEQFKILGKTNSKKHAAHYLTGTEPVAMIKGKKLYHRILIKNKNIIPS